MNVPAARPVGKAPYFEIKAHRQENWFLAEYNIGHAAVILPDVTLSEERETLSFARGVHRMLDNRLRQWHFFQEPSMRKVEHHYTAERVGISSLEGLLFFYSASEPFLYVKIPLTSIPLSRY